MAATGSGTSVTSSCTGSPPASRFWSDASPDVLRHIASHLHPAETACTLRLLNKNTAAALGTLADRTLPLSQPAPPAAFAHRWGSPGAMRPLTLQQRHRLLTLTAASGVVANLQVASQGFGLALEHTPEALAAAAAGGHADACAWLLSKGCPMGPRVLAAAAGAGRVDMCVWAVERAGCSLDGNVLAAAAEGGSMELCEWLLTHKGCPWSTDAPVAAARGGHVAVVDWLVHQHVRQPSSRRLYVGRVLEGAAEGCDVSTLQRLHGQLVEQQGERLDGSSVDRVVEAAAASRTPDWREKVRWLLYDKGYPRTALRAYVRVAEAGQEDGEVAERVELLLREGFPTAGAGAAGAVAGRGWGQALRLLLREGAPADWGTARVAAEGGHLELLQVGGGAVGVSGWGGVAWPLGLAFLLSAGQAALSPVGRCEDDMRWPALRWAGHGSAAATVAADVQQDWSLASAGRGRAASVIPAGLLAAIKWLVACCSPSVLALRGVQLTVCLNLSASFTPRPATFRSCCGRTACRCTATPCVPRHVAATRRAWRGWWRSWAPRTRSAPTWHVTPRVRRTRASCTGCGRCDEARVECLCTRGAALRRQ